MNEPWFNAAQYAWIPATLLGVLTGIWGATAGTLAQQGKGKSLVIGGGFLLCLASLASLVAAVIAYFAGQPYGVWYGLGLAGIGSIILGGLLPVVRNVYRQAEQRRMMAKDL